MAKLGKYQPKTAKKVYRYSEKGADFSFAVRQYGLKGSDIAKVRKILSRKVAA